MGWFDEQIKERREHDSEILEEAFCKISDSLTGSNLYKALQSDRMRTRGAIGDVISHLDGKTTSTDKEFPDINDELEYYCRPNGIMRRVVKLEGKWYKEAIGAYLAIDSRDGSAVALLPDKITGRYSFFDVQAGDYVKVNRKNASIFSTDAIAFYKPLPQRKITATDLLKFGLSFWSVTDIVVPIVLMAVLTLIGLLGPELNNFMFDGVYYSKSTGMLVGTAVFLASVSVSQILIGMIRGLLVAKNEVKTSENINAAVMMRILTLPNSLFMKYSSGDMVQRIEYAGSFCSIVFEIVFETGITSLLSLVYIFQMIKFAKSLVIPGIIVIILTVLYMLIATIIGIKFNKQLMLASANENGVAYSTITGVQKIKASNSEKRAFARWASAYSEYSAAKYSKIPKVINQCKAYTLLVSLIGVIVMYAIAIDDGISVADFYAFSSAYGVVLGAFISLAGITNQIANLKPTLEMIEPIMDSEPEVSEGKMPITRVSGNIELNNIYFRYSEKMPMIFNNLSLKIKSGQYVAIVGKTGCGKSTLIKLLLGFEKPQKGAVYYDGKDISSIDLRSLRRCIGTVMQDGKLFEGDVFSNIVISAPWLTLDDAWEAANLAGMADDIAAMPMGMQTLISEGSGGISGGQRQRLLIARAIAPKPKVLIFDEATSALDNLTQKKVSESLDSLHCTRIVIAHRLSTIRHCDRIIFLDGGKIVEDGSYDELIALNGQFAELVRRQQIEEQE